VQPQLLARQLGEQRAAPQPPWALVLALVAPAQGGLEPRQPSPPWVQPPEPLVLPLAAALLLAARAA
jgi:hypothetical protein